VQELKSNQMEKKTVFERLSAINLNDHVEKKDNLTYLSWAWAWSATKNACPDATYKIGETEYDDALGFMCHTTVTIEGETLEMWLPVMDGKNKSMKKTSYSYSTRYGDKQVDAATTFDINKTIMRCLVKNLAMFGLGIYIYAGEDLPEGEALTFSQKQEALMRDAVNTLNYDKELIDLKKGTDNWDAVVKYVTANKSLGIDKIGAQLVRKYKVSPALKKEIANLLNA
jgi:hypothetical protein